MGTSSFNHAECSARLYEHCTGVGATPGILIFVYLVCIAASYLYHCAQHGHAQKRARRLAGTLAGQQPILLGAATGSLCLAELAAGSEAMNKKHLLSQCPSRHS